MRTETLPAEQEMEWGCHELRNVNSQSGGLRFEDRLRWLMREEEMEVKLNASGDYL